VGELGIKRVQSHVDWEVGARSTRSGRGAGKHLVVPQFSVA